jgi:hypothetical protein
VPDDRFVGDAAGAVRWLRERPTSNGRVGTIGFCSGGRQAVLSAIALDVQAAVDCYGAFVTGRTAGELPDPGVADRRPSWRHPGTAGLAQITAPGRGVRATSAPRTAPTSRSPTDLAEEQLERDASAPRTAPTSRSPTDLAEEQLERDTSAPPTAPTSRPSTDVTATQPPIARTVTSMLPRVAFEYGQARVAGLTGDGPIRGERTAVN